MTDDQDRGELLERQSTLLKQNHDLARRLAVYEYRAMRAELLTGQAFDVPRMGHSDRLPSRLPSEHALSGAPALAVPLARIAAHRAADSLPCVGVVMEDAGPDSTRALLGLMAELHGSAFARILFLTRCLTLVPFLSRFGFACQGVGEAPVARIGEVLGPRFAIDQIRELQSGKVLWRP